MSLVVLPRTILPGRSGNIERMHKRTSYLTEYVVRNIERNTRIKIVERIQAGTRRQHAYEATFMDKPHSFLIVPASNWFANVSDTLNKVDYAVIVMFDTPISKVAESPPKKIKVYNVSAQKLLQMRTTVEQHRPEAARSQSVSLPIFRSVVESNPGNQQCKAGALEPYLVLLWEAEIEWVKNERELGYRPDEEQNLLDEISMTGKRLRITTEAGVMVFDPSKVKLELVE